MAFRSSRRRAALGAAMVAAALGVAAQARASHTNALLVGGPYHLMPIVTPGRPLTAQPRAHLEYYGGRVVSSAQVVMVLWGEGRYAPFITGASTPSLATFFEGLSGSGYLEGLSEYDTDRASAAGQPGTRQHIGRGSFAGLASISPGEAGDPAQIDDARIVAELGRQLTAGRLPPPASDEKGNPNTIYFLHFPAGKKIRLGSETSCVTFCAYHGSFDWNGVSVRYAVMPDMSAGSGCDAGCGGGTPFGMATSVASHELAEAITDPDVGLASVLGPPLAWYDPVNGEIADICTGNEGTVVGGDGVEYAVQKLWSNAQRACVVPRPSATAVASAASPGTGARPSVLPTAAASTGAPAASPVLVQTRARDLSPRPGPAAPGEPSGAAASLAAGAPAARPRSFQSEPSDLPAGAGSRFTLEEENDALGLARTDSFYTQGFRLSSRWESRSRLAPEGRLLVGFALGQNIYTPSDIRISDLETLRRDRPYAGWLYAALLWELMLDEAPFFLRAGDAGGFATSEVGVEIALGTTGPRSGAGSVQTAFHRLLRDLSGSTTGPPDPAGWSVYQTANRPTGDLALRYQFDVAQAGVALGAMTASTGSVFAARLSPRARLDVGTTFDAASLGLEVRGGLMAVSGSKRPRARVPVELYAFARADGRAVIYNGFIDGPLRGGVTPLVASAPFVGDLDVGLVARVAGLELAYAQLWRTSEIDRVPPGASRIHDVGQVRVSFLYY